MVREETRARKEHNVRTQKNAHVHNAAHADWKDIYNKTGRDMIINEQ